MRKNNNSFLEILNKIEISQPEEKKTKKIVKAEEVKIMPGKLMPRIEEREKYLKELEITESVLKKLRRKKSIEKVFLKI